MEQEPIMQGVMMGVMRDLVSGLHWQALSSRLQPTLGRASRIQPTCWTGGQISTDGLRGMDAAVEDLQRSRGRRGNCPGQQPA